MTERCQATCGRCGAVFRCGAEAGDPTCWCVELPPVLPPDPAATCLCPACLQAEVDARQASAPGASPGPPAGPD